MMKPFRLWVAGRELTVAGFGLFGFEPVFEPYDSRLDDR